MSPRRALAIAYAACAFLILAAPSFAQPKDESDSPLLIGQPKADYRARRQDLMKRIKEAEERGALSGGEPVVVLRGEDNRDREDFEEGRFRQSNVFAYLTGVEAPGAWLILLPKAGKETLYLPPGTPETGSSGVERVESTERFLGDLFAAIGDPMRRTRRPIGGSAVVYLLTPQPQPEANTRYARFVRFLREGAPTTTYKDLAPILAEMRKAKTPTEVALLRKAIDITGEAQEEAIKAIRPGAFEYEVEGKVLGSFLGGGSLRPGFSSIVGSGPNATIPHYFESSRRMEDGDFVVVDIGADYRYYTADITRTYPVSGKFTPRQREIYQLVLDTQAEIARRFKPGETRLAQLTGWARDYMRQSPLRAKDRDGREYTMEHFFIHGLSHYLGMDVHDVGRTDTPMKPGEVFTIEPGIYIKPENIGVRIEDDYLVTEDGLEKLSKGIASDPDEIERKMARARETSTSTAKAAAGSR